MVDIGNIKIRCICRKELHLNFSGAIQLAKNFEIFTKTFWSVKACSSISNLIQENAQPLTLLTDVAYEHTKTTAILSDNEISHGQPRNLSDSVSITCWYVRTTLNIYYMSDSVSITCQSAITTLRLHWRN